jgi:hypothetical protein
MGCAIGQDVRGRSAASTECRRMGSEKIVALSAAQVAAVVALQLPHSEPRSQH